MQETTHEERNYIKYFAIFLAVAVVIGSIAGLFYQKTKYKIDVSSFIYEKSSGLNPLKGFVPFRGVYDYDYSLEYTAIWLEDIYKIERGEDGELVRTLDTDTFEEYLRQISSRGHQAVVRPIIYYPGDQNATNDCLYLGEYLYEYLDSIGEIYENPHSAGTIRYPNFNNEFFVNELLNFVKLFGEKYDGDSRIGFIQLGLYGA